MDQELGRRFFRFATITVLLFFLGLIMLKIAREGPTILRILVAASFIVFIIKRKGMFEVMEE